MATYATLAELKAILRLTDTVDDSLLTFNLEAASRFVDQHCERSFDAAGTAVARTYIPTGRYEPLPIDDATEIVTVEIDDDLDYSFSTELVANIDWQAEPVNQRLNGVDWPYTRLVPFEDGWWPTRRGRATVRVTAKYGWPAVPAAVKEATLLQASRLFTRYDSPLGIAGFGDMGAMRVSRWIDPDVQQLLSPFRRLSF
ncbi:MAG TPA: head-tail connector protein [Acidimicrobiia bacterium]